MVKPSFRQLLEGAAASKRVMSSHATAFNLRMQSSVQERTAGVSSALNSNGKRRRYETADVEPNQERSKRFSTVLGAARLAPPYRGSLLPTSWVQALKEGNFPWAKPVMSRAVPEKKPEPGSAGLQPLSPERKRKRDDDDDVPDPFPMPSVHQWARTVAKVGLKQPVAKRVRGLAEKDQQVLSFAGTPPVPAIRGDGNNWRDSSVSGVVRVLVRARVDLQQKLERHRLAPRRRKFKKSKAFQLLLR